jgi:hypothetical protein
MKAVGLWKRSESFVGFLARMICEFHFTMKRQAGAETASIPTA